MLRTQRGDLPWKGGEGLVESLKIHNTQILRIGNKEVGEKRWRSVKR